MASEDDDDDEDAEDKDVYMYPTDMHPDERDAYRSAVRASKASEWEREQHENIVGRKRKTGESSRSTGTPTMMRKSQIEVGKEKDNRLFQWVRPIHLDNEVRNPDPRIATHAREFGVNVEHFSKDTDNSVQAALNSYQELDSASVGHSSRPSAAYTFASGYDGSRGGTDDGDHDSRRAGPSIGAIGKSFESMSIGTQFSDSSNETNVYPPYKMSYGQPSSSTDEEYGMSRFPYQMERGFGINTWVNFEYPIHVKKNNNWSRRVRVEKRILHFFLSFKTMH
ncbi:hypothetical protein AAG906_018132 [Vitis piasezkii]